ncbi:MAG: 3-dehydroquinate synthase [Clostridia bacterium]|nr:3-dehydroquinate synthase [Clostridia bacterium]
MQTVHIDTSRPYDVLIGSGLIGKVGEYAKQAVGIRTAAILTDTTVNALFGETVEQSFRNSGFRTIRKAFPAGEPNKRLDTLAALLEFCAENQLTRSDIIVALGGGVPGDVAGFAAAVYARGISFVQIPTTLLAAVDSSVGGKTAVDLAAGKNLAGCFHQPSLVLTDTDIMKALPIHLLRDGAAEIIKYGVLRDPELFAWMQEPNWTERIEEIIARSVAIKRDFVNQDEFDNGIRQQINLGHTFGHAIEKCSNFTLTHGQGVAIGMVIAAGAADQPDICKAIIRANQSCGLPTRSPYPAEQLAQAALTDKKRKGGTITLVLPEQIGKCALKKIDISALEDAFRRGIAMSEALS